MVGVPLIVLYYYFIVPWIADIGCVFRHVTGWYCPGCGGTRAVLALLHGHILQSLWYHPLVLYSAVIYIGFMMSHTLAKLKIGHVRGWRFHNWYLYVALVIVIIHFILKNFLYFCFHISI